VLDQEAVGKIKALKVTNFKIERHQNANP